jgi:hypothetical protein
VSGWQSPALLPAKDDGITISVSNVDNIILADLSIRVATSVLRKLQQGDRLKRRTNMRLTGIRRPIDQSHGYRLGRGTGWRTDRAGPPTAARHNADKLACDA